MNKSLNFAFIVLCFCLLMSSCVKQAPQLPSNKGVEADSSAVSLLKINSNLTAKEDSIIKKVAESKSSFKKNELGFWYKIDKHETGKAINDSVECKYTYNLKLLNNKIIESGTNQIVIGQKKIVTGLEEGLKLMHKGESATFIIPWYLGYGMTGNKPLIPPYTSIIYEVKILE